MVEFVKGAVEGGLPRAVVTVFEEGGGCNEVVFQNVVGEILAHLVDSRVAMGADVFADCIDVGTGGFSRPN